MRGRSAPESVMGLAAVGDGHRQEAGEADVGTDDHESLREGGELKAKGQLPARSPDHEEPNVEEQAEPEQKATDAQDPFEAEEAPVEAGPSVLAEDPAVDAV